MLRVMFNWSDCTADCLAADEEAGTILRYKRDREGGFVFDRKAIVTQRLKGHVRIIVPTIHDSTPTLGTPKRR